MERTSEEHVHCVYLTGAGKYAGVRFIWAHNTISHTYTHTQYNDYTTEYKQQQKKHIDDAVGKSSSLDSFNWQVIVCASLEMKTAINISCWVQFDEWNNVILMFQVWHELFDQLNVSILWLSISLSQAAASATAATTTTAAAAAAPTQSIENVFKTVTFCLHFPAVLLPFALKIKRYLFIIYDLHLYPHRRNDLVWF